MKEELPKNNLDESKNNDLNVESITTEEKKKMSIGKKIVLGIVIIFSILLILFIWIEYGPSNETIDKPLIYIYPEEEMEVKVELGNPEILTHTYPKHSEAWEVIAKPNGDLKDLKTGRELYSLFWEGKNKKTKDLKEGFVIKGEDTIEFLEEKLEILGLTEREANEFIIYWLPKMENNKYNYIRFQSEEEIEKTMPLNITPTPDTVIRVMMEFKKLNKYKEVEEQILDKVSREGYTVIEWGGSEIK